jgi:type I restriction enzyme S subunit
MTTTLPTLDSLRPNPHWAKLPLFDRKEWKTVRFGDVVENLNETERTPSGIDRFIGLEHLEPGSLHIKEWGDVADGTTFTRRCRPGQVLFGKRRAYQRKVAVAEFDALVSGDIYVFAPKCDRLLPELLPFLCLSERFFQHAVGTSAGSLSPRTNWSSLASFEFDLPPLDQQRRIAEILWAVDVMQRAAITFLEDAKTSRKTTLLNRFAKLGLKYPKEKIREVGHVQLGRQRAPKYTTGIYSKPYLRVVNILDGELDLRDVQEMDFDERDFVRYILKPGDILVTEGDITSPYNVGRSVIYRGEIPNCCFQNTLIRWRVSEKLETDYAHLALQDALYRGVFAAVASTTTVSHLGSERFGSVRLPIPPIIEQRKLCEEIAQLSQLVDNQTTHSKQSTALVGQFIQALMGEKS